MNSGEQSQPESSSLDEFLTSTINFLFSLDPTSPSASPLFSSDDDELLENMTNSFGSARTTPKDEVNTEPIIGEPQYAALTDLPTLFPYPALTLASADKADTKFLEGFAQTLAGPGDRGANSGMQMLESSNLDASCPSVVPLLDVSPTSLPLAYVHSKKKGERTAVDLSFLSHAFTEESSHPDAQKRALLVEFLRSGFYLNHEHEPRIGTVDAELIFYMAGVPLSLADDAPRNGSIFSPLVNIDTMTCLFCDKVHKSIERVIGCVRSHIGHRPFACGGDKDGCNSCTESRPARFFTGSHLRDHVSKKNNPDRCPLPDCKLPIRIGGIRRHYRSMHPSKPVPDMKTERKRARRRTHRGAACPQLFSSC
ncbi:hypothetical protein FS842_010362 [Serendipita sp. 407]|nr:hypothetical protein FS842_010362 [Serendipita sp. 407]